MTDIKISIYPGVIIASCFGKYRRIRYTSSYSIEQIINAVRENATILFGESQEMPKKIGAYRWRNNIFQIDVKDEYSLRLYFPELSSYDVQGVRDVMKVLKGTYHMRILDNNIIESLDQSFSVAHAKVKPQVLDENTLIENFKNANILENIYLSTAIKEYRLRYKEEGVQLEISSLDDKVDIFKSINIVEVLFIALKFLMDAKLHYDKIGVGRTYEEAYIDLINKHGMRVNYEFCTDSLATEIGFILARRIS